MAESHALTESQPVQSVWYPRRHMWIVVLLALFATPAAAQIAYDVTPIAGQLGDDSRFTDIRGLWGDDQYLYVIANTSLHRVDLDTREVSTVTRLLGSGAMTPNAWPGRWGFGGIWGDSSFIYVTDSGDHTVRRVEIATGEVSVIAGPGFGSPFRYPAGITAAGTDLFVGNASDGRIQRVTLPDHTVTPLAEPPGPIDPRQCLLGSGCLGYWQPTLTSMLSLEGKIYASGYGRYLRIVDAATGDVTSSAELPFIPGDLSAVGSSIYLSSASWDKPFRIGRLDTDTGEVSIIFMETSSRYFDTMWAAADKLYLGTFGQVFELDLASQSLSFFAGSVSQQEQIDGIGADARLSPYGMWGDGQRLYIADSANRSIRVLDLSTHQVTTLAGHRSRAGQIDGPGTIASFGNLRGLWGDGSHLYVADDRTVRRIRIVDGNVTTLAANINVPIGIWGDGNSILITQVGQLIRSSQTGELSVVSGGFSSQPLGVWGDGTHVYIVDAGQIVQMALATGEKRVIAYIPTAQWLWGDGQSLWVLGYEQRDGSSPGRVWRVSLDGSVESVMHGANDDSAGTVLRVHGMKGIWGDGTNLYVSGTDVIYRLSPSVPADTTSFEVPDSGSAAHITASSDGLTISHGRIELAVGAVAPAGMVIVANRANGVLISETTVPASSLLRAGRTYASTIGAVNTGLAISNPNDEPAMLSFFLTTANGSTVGEGTYTLAPRAQIARFLDEQPFGVPKGLTGSFTFRSSVPVSAIALRGYTNERSEFLMSTLPVVDLDSPLSSTPAIMAQFADGGGWTTEVILINTTDSVQSGRLDFVSGSTFGVAQIPYSIGPRTTFSYRTNGSGSTPHTGYVRVTPASGSSTPASVSIFGFASQGVRVTEASVPSVTASNTFRIYPAREGEFTQSMPGSMGVGIAIANVSDVPATVRFEATTWDGFPRRFITYPDNNRITIPARGHVSIPLHQVERYGGGVNEGVLRVTSEGGLISMVAFRTRYNERGDYLISSLPPAPEASEATSNNAALFFPHIAQGSGYTSEIVLFGAQPLKSSEGVIRYFDQAGAPLPPRFQN